MIKKSQFCVVAARGNETLDGMAALIVSHTRRIAWFLVVSNNVKDVANCVRYHRHHLFISNARSTSGAITK